MRGHILIVEDDKGWRDNIKEALEDEGHAVSTANALDQARSMLDAQSFDVAIVDINLTDVRANRDGIDVLRYIVDSRLPTQVIIVSGTETHDKEAKYQPFMALQKRDVQVLDKLLDAVDEIVARRQ